VGIGGGMKHRNFSIQDNQSFVNDITQQDVLDTAVVWIGDNLVPEDVFSDEQLNDWAFDNGFRKFE
jgi:hypothetical protein